MKNLKLQDFRVDLMERTCGDLFDIEGKMEKRLEKFMKENEVVPEIGDVIGDYDPDPNKINPKGYSEKQYKVINIEWVIAEEISITIIVINNNME